MNNLDSTSILNTKVPYGTKSKTQDEVLEPDFEKQLKVVILGVMDELRNELKNGKHQSKVNVMKKNFTINFLGGLASNIPTKKELVKMISDVENRLRSNKLSTGQRAGYDLTRGCLIRLFNFYPQEEQLDSKTISPTV